MVLAQSPVARRWRWLAAILPPLLALAVHWPALTAELFWDDEPLVAIHPRVREPGFIREIWFRDFGVELGVAPWGYYRPMLMLINIGLQRVFGPSPVAFHAFVLLAFALAAWLLARAARACRPGAPVWLAGLAGALAAVHPLRTEFAVFFMSLPDLAVEMAASLALGLALSPARRWPAGEFGAAFAGLALVAGLSKESGVFVFAALGGTLLIGALHPSHRRLLGAGLGVWLGIGLAFGLRMAAGIQSPAMSHLLGDLEQRSARTLHGVWFGTGRLLFPTETVFMNGSQPDGSALAPPLVLLCALLPLALWVWRLRRGDLGGALSAAWFGAGLGFFALSQFQNLPYTDRYFPSGSGLLGLFVIAEALRRRWHVAALPERLRPLAALSFVGWHAACAFVSTAQCVNAVGFFRTMSDQNPTLAYPKIALARVYLSSQTNFERFDQTLREVVQLEPNSPKVRELGKLRAVRLIAAGRIEEALRALAWAEEVLPRDAEIASLRGVCLASLGRRAEAEASVRRAVSLAPDKASYREQLARLGAESR